MSDFADQLDVLMPRFVHLATYHPNRLLPLGRRFAQLLTLIDDQPDRWELTLWKLARTAPEAIIETTGRVPRIQMQPVTWNEDGTGTVIDQVDMRPAHRVGTWFVQYAMDDDADAAHAAFLTLAPADYEIVLEALLYSVTHLIRHLGYGKCGDES